VNYKLFFHFYAKLTRNFLFLLHTDILFILLWTKQHCLTFDLSTMFC
jgi:hypothetical protein